MRRRIKEFWAQQRGESEGEKKLTIWPCAVITTGSLQDVTVVSASVSLQESGKQLHMKCCNNKFKNMHWWFPMFQAHIKYDRRCLG